MKTNDEICEVCNGYGIVTREYKDVITKEMADDSGHPEYAGTIVTERVNHTCPACHGTGYKLKAE